MLVLPLVLTLPIYEYCRAHAHVNDVPGKFTCSSKAESALLGTNCPQSISILNFPGADSVYRILCLIFVQAWVGVL